MSTSTPTAENGNSPGVVTASTPVTSSTTSGAIRKSIDDPSAPPPLPERIPYQAITSEEMSLTADKSQSYEQLKTPDARSLKDGCYMVKFTPVETAYHYDGTIRVQTEENSILASGDLYLSRPANDDQTKQQALEPGYQNEIPVFPVKNYRYYLRITQILESKTALKGLTLGFELWRFNGESATPMWDTKGAFTTDMMCSPGSADLWEGPVKNDEGTEIGKFGLRWASTYGRMATIEIDAIAGLERPLDNGSGVSWQSIFEKVGWKITIDASSSRIPKASQESWSDGEMHAAMLEYRNHPKRVDEWRYHMLVVPLLDSSTRGIMYDASGADTNNIPREGVGISYNWQTPDEGEWGKFRKMRFGEAKEPFFRTALHEIGHAMGLFHNDRNNGIMNTTDNIVRKTKDSPPFPGNILWDFAEDDKKRLRHMPDIFVRPGGIPFGISYPVHSMSIDEEVDVPEGLALKVSPVIDMVPFGAPVRLELSLQTTSASTKLPVSLKMKFGFVRGKVIDPSGNVRTFSPLIICVDEVPIPVIDPNNPLDDSLTLLRGVEGALFPTPGIYSVEVSVSWDADQRQLGLNGKTTIYIREPVDDKQIRAAMKVLSTPDTLLSLALTGDQHVDGNEAIEAALNNAALQPHYAYLNLKRLIQSFNDRKPSIIGVSKYLDENSVLSVAEIKKTIKLLLGGSDANILGQTNSDATNDLTREEILREMKALKQSFGRVLGDGGPVVPPIKTISPNSKDELDEIKRLLDLLKQKHIEAIGKEKAEKIYGNDKDVTQGQPKSSLDPKDPWSQTGPGKKSNNQPNAGAPDDANQAAGPIFGAWEKATESDCSKKYPQSIVFNRDGSFKGQAPYSKMQPVWDIGSFTLYENVISMSTSNDAVIKYSVTLSNDNLEFKDPDGCVFTYRRLQESQQQST